MGGGGRATQPAEAAGPKTHATTQQKACLPEFFFVTTMILTSHPCRAPASLQIKGGIGPVWFGRDGTASAG